MILGIGIDSVEIERFKDWHLRPPELLRRIFSPEEIIYAQKSPALAAQRFAVRFAAKEALVKAIRQKLNPSCPFLSLCAAAHITKHPDGRPELIINWHQLPGIPDQIKNCPPTAHLSLTHCKTIASAFAVIEQ